MKIGVSSYSFSQYIRAGKMTQFDTIAKAKELGFDDIEFTPLTPPEGETKLSFAKRLKEEAERVGIEISAYVIGADFSHFDNSETVKMLKEELLVAKELGVSLMRHDIVFSWGDFRTFDQAISVVSKDVREVTEYAKTLGIKTMSENHGRIAQDSDRIERLITAVDSDNYGVLIDMGNFLCADENPADAVSRLANLAFMVHAKDFQKVSFDDYKGEEGYFKTRGCNYLQGTVVGDGDVPVAQCIAILKEVGYDGHIDIEYEGPQDCIESLKKGLAYLRSVV